MAVNEIINNKIVWTFIWSWVIIFPIFWIELILVLLMFLLILQTIDFLTGYISARQKWFVNSKIWINWMIKKSLIYLIPLVLITWVWVIKYSWLIQNDYIWLIPLVFLCIFCYLELISIFENFAVIFWNSKQWKIFSVLANLSNLLFNISLDKIKENTEKRIKNKFNKDE